jgi:arabinofuranosyltransferase
MTRTAELRLTRIFLPGLFLAFLIVLIRTAWISDDAYITFRTVENFLNGYGLRWNVAERVQSYTHPLWMLLVALAHSVAGEPYFATLALSVLCTLFALIVTLRLAQSPAAAVVGLGLLISSKAFVDYSTSGLENPLTHALLALFWWLCWRHPDRAGWLGLAVSLILLNRMDCVLLVAPAVGVALVRAGTLQWAIRLAAGLVPFAAWELFSLVYYGVPFPNTAYAKLGTGMGRRDLAWQASLYFQDSLGRDPITLLTIAAVCGWILVSSRRRDWTIAAGLLLYFAYIVRIGGDFMSGRFLAAPFLMAVLALVHMGVPRRVSMPVAVCATIVAFAAIGSRRTVTGSDFGSGDQLQYISSSGISDERAFYYQWTGLLRVIRGNDVSATPWAREGKALAANGPRVIPARAVGLVGYYAGPSVHVVDVYALGDPLLSRLPATDAWRIGHFERRLPKGYLETLETGQASIHDPGLAALYRTICVVTRTPLLNRERFQAVLDLNLKRHDHFLEEWKAAARVPTHQYAVGTLP